MVYDLERALSIASPSDWYRASQAQIKAFSPAIFNAFEGLGGPSPSLSFPFSSILSLSPPAAISSFLPRSLDCRLVLLLYPTYLSQGLSHVLSQAYPDFTWDPSRFSPKMQGKRASQRALFNVVKELYPGEEVLEEWSDPERLRYSRSKQPMR